MKQVAKTVYTYLSSPSTPNVRLLLSPGEQGVDGGRKDGLLLKTGIVHIGGNIVTLDTVGANELPSAELSLAVIVVLF